MPGDDVPRVTESELARLLANPDAAVWLVHATDAAGFADGHIPGSLAAIAPALLVALAAGSPVVVYGEHAAVAAAPALAHALQRSGVEVAWFEGGLAAWTAAGHPVERLG